MRFPSRRIGRFHGVSSEISFGLCVNTNQSITMNTINITPSWSSLILPMLEVLKNPKADPKAKKEITSEILRLARIADQYNEQTKQS